jgi:hypothetical protein
MLFLRKRDSYFRRTKHPWCGNSKHEGGCENSKSKRCESSKGAENSASLTVQLFWHKYIFFVSNIIYLQSSIIVYTITPQLYSTDGSISSRESGTTKWYHVKYWSDNSSDGTVSKVLKHKDASAPTSPSLWVMGYRLSESRP